MIRVWFDSAAEQDPGATWAVGRDRGRRAWTFADEPAEVLALPAGAPDPLGALERFARGRFCVALCGYDLGRAVERLPSIARDDHGLPDLWAAAFAAPPSDRPPPAAGPPARVLGPLAAERGFREYAAGVRRALDAIAAGDVYQVNLAHRLRAPAGGGDLLAVYRHLRARSPAPMGAFVDAGEFQVLSNSPELFLRYQAGTRALETRPIKGTRPRGAATGEDARLRADLARDGKERAEHVMIVDLLRNDLGRVCETGSVRAGDLHRVVSLPTVHHAVTAVRGTVRPGTGLAEVLRAVFPGGSVTGAPKVAAMRLIEEIEPVRRGLYTGAIGLVRPDGSFTFSIAIRTAIARGGEVTVHVGGGIVADSTPEREWAETWDKAAAFVTTLREPSGPRGIPTTTGPHPPRAAAR